MATNIGQQAEVTPAARTEMQRAIEELIALARQHKPGGRTVKDRRFSIVITDLEKIKANIFFYNL